MPTGIFLEAAELELIVESYVEVDGAEWRYVWGIAANFPNDKCLPVSTLGSERTRL